MTILVSDNEDGHRGEYIAIVSGIVTRAGRSVRLARRGWRHTFSRDALLFMMVEDSPLECFLVSLARGLMGKRTAAFLFKPAECLAPEGTRWRAKRLALILLKRFPSVSVITIMPFSVQPRLAAIARAAIYDPQLWDLEDLGRSNDVDSALSVRIAEQAQGRMVVAAMGFQSADKGFDFFSRLLKECPALGDQYLFVSAGRVAANSRNSADALVTAGGLLLDRGLTVAEMTALYRSATLIWCCYAPRRDMASGIFGRAVQYGTPAIIREGSYLEKIAAELGYPVTAVPWNDPQRAEQLLSVRPPEPAPPDQHKALVRRLRAESVAVIHSALGLL